VRISGICAILDNVKDESGIGFTGNCSFHFRNENPIPVCLYRNYGELNIVGTVSIEKFGNVLLYNGQLYKEALSSSEIAIIGNLYPCISGIILKKIGSLISEFAVKEIELAFKNADPRVPRIYVEEE